MRGRIELARRPFGRARSRLGTLAGWLLVAACGNDPAPLPALIICFSPDPALPSPEGGCAAGKPGASYPADLGACDLAPEEPGHLVVTTTDFSTGALSVVTPATHTVVNDVALTSTDAVPFYHDGLLYVVHRYQVDTIDLLDPCDRFVSRGQFPLALPGVPSPNPQAVAFREDGLAFVSLFGAPQMAVIDFSRPYDEAVVNYVDTSQAADADGNPETSLTFACGNTIFSGARRLARPGWTPVDHEVLLAIDAETCQPYDTAIDLLGVYAKTARLDPSDATARTVLILTSGIERVDLVAGTSEWALSAAELAAVGVDDPLRIQAFDLASDGLAYLAIYAAGYRGLELWRGHLDGPAHLERIAEGLDSAETALEVIGTELWVGDRSHGGSGLRVYDLNMDPPELLAGPLNTGLAPYSMIAVP